MIVITLTKVPPSLRGDLTKWYQEVQTGVYAGNVSARVRDKLWDRIKDNIGSGQATMVYSARNELGYQFRTTRADYQVVDYDGIPLLMRLNEAPATRAHGFSDAAKMHHALMSASAQKGSDGSTGVKTRKLRGAVALDLETTGLNADTDHIIAIGAVKIGSDGQQDSYYRLVDPQYDVPAKIVELTHLTNDVLTEQGVSLSEALGGLREFVELLPIIGYNVNFDDEFLSAGYAAIKEDSLEADFIDLKPVVKRNAKFLANYRLGTVLEKYGIQNDHPHNALADAQATMDLAMELTKNGALRI